MKSCVVIPARLASTRLPNKMLLAETGMPLVQHTHLVALGARKPASVIVATDHPDIERAVESFGGRAVMTPEGCASGADRVAAVAETMPQYDIFVNLQGDEPEMDPRAIDQVVGLLEANPAAPMATLATPIRDEAKLNDPAIVKVVFNASGRAIYFSRSPIPHYRDAPTPPLDKAPPLFHQHLGIYAYRREFLLRMAELPPSQLELAERLEQLRVLDAGETIFVGSTPHGAPGIDTPADYAGFVQRYTKQRLAA